MVVSGSSKFTSAIVMVYLAVFIIVVVMKYPRQEYRIEKESGGNVNNESLIVLGNSNNLSNINDMGNNEQSNSNRNSHRNTNSHRNSHSQRNTTNNNNNPNINLTTK